MDIYTDFPQDKTLVDLFNEQVLRTPNNIAIEFEGEALRYKELDRDSGRMAFLLKQKGIKKGDIIAISAERSSAFVITLLAILKVGAAYLPIDPKSPLDRLNFMLKDSGSNLLIIEAKYFPATGLNVTTALLEELLLNLPESPEITNQNICASDLANVIYTSGSTGKPKGVLVEHRNMVNMLLNAKVAPGITAHDTFLSAATISFDIIGFEVFLPLIVGAKIVIAPNYLSTDGVALIKLIERSKVTIAQGTPSTWHMLINSGWQTKLKLKAICGGEHLSADLSFKLLQRVDSLWNVYGPTETTVYSTCKLVTDCENITIGRPIQNVNIYILNNDLKPLSADETGEICISGLGVSRGYLNRPELTKDRFIPDPFDPDGGILYRTGDFGKVLENGELIFIGRKDDQVKIRGYRIEIGEIENILEQLVDVNRAVVVTKDDKTGYKQLIAYVHTLVPFDRSGALSFLESKLPSYMIPNLIIPIGSIPQTANGKVDRKKLPDPSVATLTNTSFRNATSEMEQLLISILQNVLQIKKIGVDDNFFELGGNSLLAQYFVSELNNHGINLPIVKLYQFPTVAKIRNFLTSHEDSFTASGNNTIRSEDSDIAIIGMSGRFPGANTIHELWNILKEGKETIRNFHEEELDPLIDDDIKSNPNYVKAKGIIDGADEFDARFFDINPLVAKAMDPQQRKFLEICWEALESSGYSSAAATKSIAVFAGSNTNSYYINNVHSNNEILNKVGAFQCTLLNNNDYVATRVAYSLNLSGPAISVQSACSTSLLAIAQAVMSLRSGQCEMALAGGVSIANPIISGHLYEEGAILSSDGHCRPFDADAKGTLFCDGAAVVLLKKKSQAQKDGDIIYAVIKGIGISNDGGAKGSFTAPSVDGQAICIKNALRDANLKPSEIGYIEAHGTATPIGDPIEIEGLNIAFGQQVMKNSCAIGSIKSNMGHLVHAAGAAGFIKTCLSLYNKQIPPSINFKKANPHLKLEDSPFYVNDKLFDWDTIAVRRAGVSSFGVGGTNVHIILEENLKAEFETSIASPIQLITWSAKSEDSMKMFGTQLSDYIHKKPGLNLADLAFTLNKRAEFKHRSFSVVDQDGIEVPNSLTLTENRGENLFHERPDDLVFLFPGQGAQYLKMGRDLYQSEPAYRDAVDECAKLLENVIDEDIRDIIFSTTEGDNNERSLNNTYYTQPSLFITEYALAKLWMSWGVKPDIMIGHSIGEFVAAHLAGVFSLKDALCLIGNRAKLMRDLPSGNMLAVRLKHETLIEMLPSELSIAAINTPLMTVVAGSELAIMRFAEYLGSQNIAARKLNTSHAFHSKMMEPILLPFEKIVSEIQLRPPAIAIISTLTGTWLQDHEATNPKYWANHMRETVQFSKAIETLVATGRRILGLECGPKNSSTTFTRQQTNRAQVTIFPSLAPSPHQNERVSVLRTAGNLWINGIEIDWQNFHFEQTRKIIYDLPNYSFEKTVCWIEPAHPAKVNHSLIEITHTSEVTNKENTETSSINMRKTNLIEKLKEILENAAGIETTGVDPKSNFLEIGLDSLLLTQIALTLKKEFKLPITFRKLTEEYNSLDLLAEYLDANIEKDSPAPSVIPTNKQMDVSQKENGSINLASESPIDHISRQIQLLAQQIAVLQNGESIKENTPSFATSDSRIKVSLENDITPEEAIELKKPFGATARIERQSQELSPRQRNYLNNLVARYNEKTQGSKAYTQAYRSCMADPRVVSGFRPNTKELVYQLVVKKSEGSYLWDIDGNKYIDMLNGFGSTMLGYQPDFIKEALRDQIDKGFETGPQHELAGEVSKLICEFTKHERVAFCNTGSEAVLGAMRVARTVTGKNLIVAFSGSYHGIMDEVLVRGTKKLKTFPAASGILSDNVQNMLILEYGTDESLSIIRNRADEIAAVLVEPVQSRRPEFQPIEFLKTLRSLTEEKSIALVFDEVITGFRMHPGGAQALFDIKADIATYGKVVGGGMPIGVIAGSRLYMDALDGGFWQYGDASIPEIGVTYFAGTFVRHPLTLSAAKAILLYMKEKGPKLQEDLNHKTQLFTSELQAICEKYKVPFFVVRFGSLWKIKFKEEYPYSELVFALMRKKGIHIWDGFPCFLVESHTKDDLDFVVQKFEDSIIELLDHDFIPTTEPLKLHYPEETSKIFAPPVPGALLGKDAEGNPAWFLPDDNIPGKYLQIK